MAIDMSEFESVKLEKAKVRSYDVPSQKWSEDEIFVKIAPVPFSKGALREAYRMLRYNTENSEPETWVAKLFMKTPENKEKSYEDDVILQTVSKHYGELFNERNPPKIVKFMDAFIMVLQTTGEWYAIEPYIIGEYTKHSNNVGFIDFEHWRNTPHAFSHFSYEISNQNELVCDIQGVNDLYTDPQLHSIDITKYGSGNLGRKGIALFFYTHRCNPLCTLFKLRQFDHYKVIETFNDQSKSIKEEAKPDLQKHLTLWKNTTMTSSFATLLRSMRDTKSSKIDLRKSLSKDNNENNNESNNNNDSKNDNDDNDKSGENSDNNSKNFRESFTRANLKEIKSSFRAMSPQVSSIEEKNELFELLPISSHNNNNENNNDNNNNESLLETGKIHRELADLHEHGRLNILDKMMYSLDCDNKNIIVENGEQNVANFPAVFYHYQKAAICGDVISMLILARIHSGTARDVLPDVKLENPSRVILLLKLAADKGHLGAMYHTAQAFQHGYYEATIDYKLSVEYYDKLMNIPFVKDPSDENIHGFNLDELQNYEIYAAIAQMYEEGGNNLEQDYTKAAEYYGYAAEDAMDRKKGKLSAKYYEQAEVCGSM